MCAAASLSMKLLLYIYVYSPKSMLQAVNTGPISAYILINASEQGVIHDGVLGQELGVSQNGLHQHALGMGVHIHWTVADVCVCVEREQGPPTNKMICTQNGA